MTRKKASLSPEQIYNLHTGNVPAREIAKRAGVSHVTVLRTIEKVKDKVREADEFQVGTATLHVAPRRDQPFGCWDLATIRATRDDQLRGVFKRPVDLAKHMRTDDALYTAYHTRLAPQAAIRRSLVPAAGVRGRAVMKKAAASVTIAGSVLMSIHGTLADHGIAIGYNEQQVSAGGARVDFKHVEWPLEHVRYNSSTEQLETPTRNGQTVPIVHGDGRWTIYRKFATLPWTQEAAVLPGAFVWASHAMGLSDWNQSATAIGLSKLIGELPPGVPLGTADAPGPEAAAFLRMLQNLVSGNAAAGIRPAGSKTDFVSDRTTNYQVFSELTGDRAKAAARIYLGTDAILGSVGGAPGIDIAALFALASSKLQGDFECFEQAIRSGVFEPWAAINEGDSRYAPWLVYKLPDTDAIRHAEEQSKKKEFFFAAVKQYQDGGFTVDQPLVDILAREYGVVPSPRLAAAPRVKIEFAPTQRDRYVFANEARVSDGLPPNTAFDGKTLGQLAAEEAASAKDSGAPAPTPATEPPSLSAPPRAAAKRTRARNAKGNFEEHEHPRADDGKFGSGSGSPKKEGDGGQDDGGGLDDNAKKALGSVFDGGMNEDGVRGVLGHHEGAFGGAKPKITVAAAEGGGVRMTAEYSDANGRPVAHVQRSFHRDPSGKLIAKHEVLDVNEDVRGKGYGSKAVASQLAQYEKLGVSRVDLEATWDGPYVWSKAGWSVSDPEAWSTMQGRWAEHVDGLGVDADVADTLKGFTSPSQIARASIGGEKAGKEFLRDYYYQDREAVPMTLEVGSQGYKRAVRYFNR